MACLENVPSPVDLGCHHGKEEAGWRRYREDAGHHRRCLGRKRKRLILVAILRKRWRCHHGRENWVMFIVGKRKRVVTGLGRRMGRGCRHCPEEKRRDASSLLTSEGVSSSPVRQSTVDDVVRIKHEEENSAGVVVVVGKREEDVGRRRREERRGRGSSSSGREKRT
ncbi:uncharacterized protein LOC134769283 [Penaeus indicus]|uniref:uncharacterized protein LOC134769283 n=1 Tax=Penaeus indicus TaxID=29960 RepID=UPI00300D5B99